jgi:hypothetical protein
MKFYSLRQYFYTLYTWLFALILVPLFAFVICYRVFRFDSFQTIEFGLSGLSSASGFVLIAFAAWVVSYWIFWRNIEAFRKLQSLGERLSRYARLTIVRYLWIVTGMMTLVVGYYITFNGWLTVVFLLSMGMPLLIWPLPSRVCRDLKLKGDERMVVLYRMDVK